MSGLVFPHASLHFRLFLLIYPFPEVLSPAQQHTLDFTCHCVTSEFHSFVHNDGQRHLIKFPSKASNIYWIIIYYSNSWFSQSESNKIFVTFHIVPWLVIWLYWNKIRMLLGINLSTMLHYSKSTHLLSASQ